MMYPHAQVARFAYWKLPMFMKQQGVISRSVERWKLQAKSPPAPNPPDPLVITPLLTLHRCAHMARFGYGKSLMCVEQQGAIAWSSRMTDTTSNCGPTPSPPSTAAPPRPRLPRGHTGILPLHAPPGWSRGGCACKRTRRDVT